MTPRHDMPGSPFGPNFPTLPIVTPPPTEPRRSTAERYGALFYLGLVGLALAISLVGWFGWSAWSMRGIWADIYTLHDASRTEAERVRAARRLSVDPRLSDEQKWEMALRRPLPPVARYLLAESVGSDAVAHDPRGYTLAVARSADWPVWLRSALARPIAVAATRGQPIDRQALDELARRPEPSVALWAVYARVVRGESAAEELRSRIAADDAHRGLADLLDKALRARSIDERLAHLEQAAAWMRTQDPDVAPLWTLAKPDLDGLRSASPAPPR